VCLVESGGCVCVVEAPGLCVWWKRGRAHVVESYGCVVVCMCG